MKTTLSLLLVCLSVAVVVSAEEQRDRSPEFIVRNGVLVRKGDATKIDELPTAVPHQFSTRIVGGGDAAENSAPWIMSLQWGTIRPAHFCGGALVASNWILTAAHCSASLPNYGISTVASGLHNLNSFGGHEQIRQINSEQIFTHEDWDGFVGPHDIALIWVAQPFANDFSVRPIALPNDNVIHTGNARLHGWGSTSTGFVPVWPTNLQTAELPIVPIATCTPLFDNIVVDNSNVCTGPLTGGVGACSGDSGSPLVQNDELVGIFAHTSVPCGQANRPSVYVRVSAYISWINDIIDNN